MDLVLKILLYIFAAPFVLAGVIIGAALLFIVVAVLVLIGLLATAFARERRNGVQNPLVGWHTIRRRVPGGHAGRRWTSAARTRANPGPASQDLTASDGVRWEAVDEDEDEAEAEAEAEAAGHEDCPECLGTGVATDGNPCPTCGGEGRIER
jgi:hypothetical protein